MITWGFKFLRHSCSCQSPSTLRHPLRRCAVEPSGCNLACGGYIQHARAYGVGHASCLMNTCSRGSLWIASPRDLDDPDDPRRPLVLSHASKRTVSCYPHNNSCVLPYPCSSCVVSWIGQVSVRTFISRPRKRKPDAVLPWPLVLSEIF
ncbi:hypothetical protein SODALDRAFT_84997 [Sodiomyces alkalinus F11]|uniref:Uncharacterized protein n=1 Tax=Sodiomyces alkalinus (strain CBS 110278 / VKM F-3762 / F11) TaxID=1314773 RepID=A0A3N2PK24_SODAK|nr:hypothetical protein SODALDRAFT_130482 [Sodiomyces alkalinus F11]XP_028462586.1 hypothetical protein SODALDRAFT_84997 [Sodiomyces alkalinus F11]ROT34456.1 hypothetical protein SODALDRAFT_130482 [Sodiomyces alkalinus F11]ROT34780.1 hypothetical protein SODALDRAFT_84997 [Sodiomyces alkalinus F11]